LRPKLFNKKSSTDEPTTSTAEVSQFRKLVKSTASSVASSRESATSGLGSLNLAIPHLAGFIESWNPFGSGRFFDTPPDPVPILPKVTNIGSKIFVTKYL
jgi:hypothetical protein